MLNERRLPGVLWIAARPPVPPFSGPTSKTLCGIAALAPATRVEVVSFPERGREAETREAFSTYWGSRVAAVHWLTPGPRSSGPRAILTGTFQFGSQFENAGLPELLDRLGWDREERLLIFDDIVLAPFLTRYGGNAIFSPHDCMSRMFHSHFRQSPPGLGAFKYLLQSRIARRYEQAYYHRALLTHVITQRDRVWLEAINPRARYEVVPNSDLLNPGFSPSAENDADVLVWGDLGIGSIARGARAFLAAWADDRHRPAPLRVRLVGRVPEREAQRIVGRGLLEGVHYAPRLENDRGELAHARVTVVPDIGGAGIKNRCVNMLSSGRCLACLYPQMEGIERACDLGALNATGMDELVAKVRGALLDGSWQTVARAGGAIYAREYGEKVIRGLWENLVRRAVAIRAGRN